MYEPFPGNYVWNLSVNICLNMGGVMGEIDPANDEVRAVSTADPDQGTEAFFSAWGKLADRVLGLAAADDAAGHRFAAAEKYARAAAYFITAERMQSRDFAPRKAMYASMLETMKRFYLADGQGIARVEFPYEGSSLSAVFIPGRGEGPRPCMIFCNGLDSTKEMVTLALRDRFARRGISTLVIDQPGVGEALRLKELHAVHDTERWASAAVDYLETRGDVDHGRVGMMGWSMGGYYAPRALAYEPRFAIGAVWGGNHDWGGHQKARLEREGDMPVPHYWEHVMWVWGQPDIESFMSLMEKVNLNGHLGNIKVPFLVTHGGNDRQIPIKYAQQSYDQAVNSPDRELKIFNEQEGGIEHCGADNMEPVQSYIADWLADRFARMERS
ncbi:alpha/beta hydrolase family protein [Sphingobium sp.]|uniref:alpha/beta hydrolase family protein n=1 Tax=Sphingobium sp. TaxID=1912891 RepID=UPI002C2A102C|nr:alpha/beta fold hydrolase [Sphingobium sp.]HUD92960.1 alpha/beta fold hydrolase [Sphingobium sp.]